MILFLIKGRGSRGKEKTFFHEKKSFFSPPDPLSFSKKAGYLLRETQGDLLD